MNREIAVTGHLDWMTATLKDQSTAFNVIPPVAGIDIVEKMQPPRFFQKAWALYPAGFVAIQDTKYKTAMLHLTGQDLQAWREAGIADQTTIKALNHMVANITRVDYCVNVHNMGKVAHCVRHMDIGKRTGRPKPYARFKRYDNSGDTLYFGSPKSAQRVTIYDKAAQLKIKDEFWTRIELRCRKPAASVLLRDMEAHGMNDAGRQRIRDLVNYPNLAWWKKAMHGNEVQLEKIPRKVPSVITWLYEQVLPVFYKEHEEDTALLLAGFLAEASIALRDNNTGIDRRPDIS